MTENGEFKTAYFAGLFDGEGHISIVKNGYARWPSKNKKYTRYSLKIGIANTNRKAIEAFASWTGNGNSWATNNSNPKRGRGLPIYYWGANGEKAREVLERLLPYLIIKWEQAELALRFREWHEGVIPKGKQMYRPRELKIFEEYRKEMMLLKTNIKSWRIAYAT